MSNLLGGKPKVPTPKAPPAKDEARENVADLQEYRKRRGRAANQLVAQETQVSTAAKQLTGN